MTRIQAKRPPPHRQHSRRGTAQMDRILVCDPLAPAGIEILQQAGEVIVKTDLDEMELAETVTRADAIVVRSGTQVTERVLQAADSLKIIARAGVGVDNIDVAAATRRGIVVVNSPAGNTLAAAEHTMALMMAASREIPQACAELKSGDWSRKSHLGRQLFEKQLGIVGLGKVGAEVARRAGAFGMKISAYDPFISREQAEAVGVELLDTLQEVASQADYLSLHCALTPDTEDIIDGEILSAMKPEATLINTARGGLVDEDALIEALTSGQIAAAALDVFIQEPTHNRELIELDNVIVTPHIAASTHEAQVNVAVDAARQVVDVLSGRLPRWPVNAPPLSAEALDAVQPYVELVGSLGILARAVMSGPPQRIELSVADGLRGEHLQYLTGRLLVTILTRFIDSELNYINAPAAARERGIEIAQTRGDSPRGYSNWLQVSVHTSDSPTTISGALFEGADSRIVRINGYRLELAPRQTVILVWNADPKKPGFVGKIGTLLGEAGINITGIQVARNEINGTGLMAATVAGQIAEEVAAQIGQLPGVVRVEIADMEQKNRTAE